MKAILTSAPQANGYPSKMVDLSKEENHSAVIPLNKEDGIVLPLMKKDSVTDTPEAWDESWFANYE